jgi:thiol-disulfide isomerase/thioredoxin
MARAKDRQKRVAEIQAKPGASGRRWLLIGIGGFAALVVTVVVVLGYTGSRGGGAGQSNAGDGQPAVTAVGGASPVKLSVPNFSVTAAPFVGGQRFVLAQHADKPTLMYFMASWCSTCVPESRAISQLQAQMGQQVNFVILDMDPSDTESGLQHFWEAAAGSNSVWALDKGSKVSTAYNVRSLDTTILIANGQELSRTVGGLSVDQLKAVLAKAGVSGS